MMEERRYSEEDFPAFVQELIDNKRLNEEKEYGIAKLVVDKGYEALSDKQKHVFVSSISYYVYDQCGRCPEDIPWSEMSAAEDNGGLCSWCQQLTRDMRDDN